jgi:hypothetical protein
LLYLGVTSVLVSAQSKAGLRYEIDTKREGVTYTSREALPRGREFKRIDSTYYVGWMFEGGYKYEHAADHLGFTAAASQLQRALDLMYRDFKKELHTRTSDVMTYLSIMQYHRDWDFTTYALMQCYSNMNKPDQVWLLLQRCRDVNMQDELYMDTYNYMGWTIHRNRYLSNKTYPFLKASIDENERFANLLLDSAARKIKKDAALNKPLFGDSYEKEKMPAVWHYKSILYTYQLDIESGAAYYDKLRSTSYFPLNNYATFCAVQAKFRDAGTYYNLSKDENTGDKRLNESYYYLSIINQYAAKNKQGIQELQSVIKANGSTPGFGWYNLALARNHLYDGQYRLASQFVNKAAQFKEIHIGTTLGQHHYDFTISLLNLIIKNHEIESIFFERKDWWYSPSVLKKLTTLFAEKYGIQFLIINQFASNPERDRVIYKLFSSESTVSFDEIYTLIEGFSTNYFLHRFEKEVQKDTRPEVKRYYTLFVSGMLMKKKQYKKALEQLNRILAADNPDLEYERLFLARIHEMIATCQLKLNENESAQKHISMVYKLYPQLLPFSGLHVPMRLHTNPSQPAQQIIIDQLKSTSIQWTTSNQQDIPDVYITFTKKQNLPVISITVKLNGKSVVQTHEISYSKDKHQGKEIAYRLFNCGTTTGQE